MPRKPDQLQGSLDLIILKTLETGPNHGFGITLHIESVSEGLLQVEEGSLYPALHRLERDALIAGEWKVTENQRRARIYRITPAGRKRLAEATDNWKNVSKGVSRLLRFAQ
jgi:PadR family transcriptional regulator, regulatory protein PadR